MARCFCFLFVIIFLVGCNWHPRTEDLHAFQNADDAFVEAENLPSSDQKAGFRSAALMYQELIDRGVHSGPIYYNMGNAWARCDEPGKAIAAYKMAKRYMPLNSYIDTNLQTILGRVPSNESVPVFEHLFFWQNWFSYPLKAKITLVLSGCTFMLGVIHLVWPRKRLRSLFLGFLAVSIVAIASTGYDWHRFDSVTHAVIAIDLSIPRKGNSEQYEPSFTDSIPLGTEAILVGQRGNWFRLKFRSGGEGWVPKEHVVLY
ncbi:MAG: hypothetical protein ACRCUY_08080 [Thermoguttaceae bacterium]